MNFLKRLFESTAIEWQFKGIRERLEARKGFGLPGEYRADKSFVFKDNETDTLYIVDEKSADIISKKIAGSNFPRLTVGHDERQLFVHLTNSATLLYSETRISAAELDFIYKMRELNCTLEDLF